jgi:hypothetical protein
MSGIGPFTIISSNLSSDLVTETKLYCIAVTFISVCEWSGIRPHETSKWKLLY